MDLLTVLFLFFIYITIAALIWYFYKLAQHDKEELFKKEIEQTVKEVEAEEWLAHSFVPDVLAYIKKHPKIIIKYTFFALIAIVFFWSLATEGISVAVRNVFLTCVIYASLILYIYTEPRLFETAKNHLPRKLRHTFDNDWIRGYVFFLLPAAVFSFFVIQPFTFHSFLFIYSALFVCLIAATRLSMDLDKEQDQHKKKLAKKILEEE